MSQRKILIRNRSNCLTGPINVFIAISSEKVEIDGKYNRRDFNQSTIYASMKGFQKEVRLKFNETITPMKGVY
jgi:hypothetical protein